MRLDRTTLLWIAVVVIICSNLYIAGSLYFTRSSRHKTDLYEQDFSSNDDFVPQQKDEIEREVPQSDRSDRAVIKISSNNAVKESKTTTTPIPKNLKKRTEKQSGDFINRLPEKWKKQFDALKDRNRRPVRLRMTSDYANPGWFGFLSVPASFSECSVPCKPYIDDKGVDFPSDEFDLVLVHHAQCKASQQGDIERFEPKNTDRRFLTIQANIRNEPDSLTYRECSEGYGGVDEFETSPVDITISYSRNSTVVGNYYYTKPSSFVFKEKTKEQEEAMFQGMCAFVRLVRY
jgi:hypothetical protein